MTRIFTLFLLFLFVMSSCSSSKRSYTYHKKRNKTRTERKESAKHLAGASLRDNIIIHATKHAGRPYRYGGKKPSSGFDCSGFITWVYNEVGLDVKGASHQQAKLGRLKEEQNLRPGDLVFFGNGGKVSHVSIVLSNKNGKIQVIHSTSSRGVVIDEITTSRYWRKRYLFGRDVVSAGNYDIASGGE